VGFWRLLLREVYLTLMPKQVKRSRSFLIDVTKGLTNEQQPNGMVGCGICLMFRY